MLTPEEIVRILDLQPLEGEGGMYRSTYRSAQTLDGAPIGSAIYYFLTDRSFSHLHRLTGDETYHFYLGDPVDLVELHPDGRCTVTRLGTDLAAGQVPQHTVPAGTWQGSRLAKGGSCALLGTTMAPAYTDGCYTHGDPQALRAAYPDAADWIDALTGEAVFF